MLELFRVLLPTMATLFQRHDLVFENLLLRRQLQIALRSRPRPHLNHDRPIAASACSLRHQGRRSGTVESPSDLSLAVSTTSTSE